MDISSMFKHMISITQFNKGKASQMFSRVQKGESLIVIKNNNPVAIIIPIEEYEILNEFPKLGIKTADEELKINEEKYYEILNKWKFYNEERE